MSKLAIFGGGETRASGTWPRWPECDERTETAVVDVLRSRRWTVSWPSAGSPALEREFAIRFAEYNGVPYCVSVDHGSSALVVALEGLDIGPGDEVLVPVMTWVASATAVLRVGATPVLVDVDPETGCLAPEAAEAAIGERTRAMIVVHHACTVADLDSLVAIARKHGLAVVEDCAQAHGARWNGRNVGTFGAAGAFSFQQGKALAGGEGGAVITASADLYLRAQQLRADSRSYAADVQRGEMEIIEDGGVCGGNYCMSELSAAVLLDQLGRIEDQHARREQRAAELGAALQSLGLSTIPVPPQADRRSIYEFGIRFDERRFQPATVEQVAAALSAELNCAIYPPDTPLQRSGLMRPETKKRFAEFWDPAVSHRGRYPGAEQFRRTTLMFHHSVLLGEADLVHDFVAAFRKVDAELDALSKLAA